MTNNDEINCMAKNDEGCMKRHTKGWGGEEIHQNSMMSIMEDLYSPLLCFNIRSINP